MEELGRKTFCKYCGHDLTDDLAGERELVHCPNCGKELELSDSENPETSAGAGTKEELEQLRELFQKELDKASSAQQDGPLIQALDEIPNEEPEKEEPISEEDLCECCGEKMRDKSIDEDYPYCSDCRKLMLSNPLNFFGIFMALIMLVVAGFGVGRIAANVSSWESLLDAKDAYQNGYIYDAATLYGEYLSTADSNSYSVKAVKDMAEIYAHLGSMERASQLIDQYFSETQLKLPWNKKYTQYAQKSKDMTSINQTISENFTSVFSGEKYKYKDEIKKVNKLIAESKNNKEAGQYDLIYLEYIKYMLMSRNGDKPEDLLKQLKNVEAADNGDLNALYYIDLISVNAKAGKADEAEKYFNKLIEFNRQDSTAYLYYSDVYRFADKPDADKIIELAEKAEKDSGTSGFPAYHKIYAIGYLLKGENEKAFSSMDEYLQSLSSYSGQAGVAEYNFYAICAIAAKQTETYNQIKDMFKQYKLELSPLVEKYKKGKLTIEQVLSDKGGEL